MPAARCSICGANFPLEYAGLKCPICDDEVLEGLANDVPDDVEELDRRVNEAEFERYYERTRGHGPDA